MSRPAPLLPLTQLDGSEVHVHVDRIVKITPSTPESIAGSAPKPEPGSTLTVAIGTGTASIDVTEYLLNRGPANLAGFLRLTDLHGIPIKINPAYVILARSHPPAGTLLEVYSSTGTEPIYVRDGFPDVTDWWAGVAQTPLVDPSTRW